MRTFCGNESCVKATEYSGGRFRYDTETKKFFCEDCFAIHAGLNPCKDLWNFSTTHFNGHKIEIKGLKHLDQLCRQFGVSNHARENMERNWNTPPPDKRPAHLGDGLEKFRGGWQG
jgi:hypothetical protein